MDTVTPLAPSPGSAAPGNLYADLQSRTLWLGVDSSVDPTGSVLVSDIVALQAADTTTLNNAKAYTDSQITTRAPTVHTHTSTQITDFNAAVTAVASAIPALQWVKGMILMWSGLLSDIGVGPLAGWSLCDGSNSTPDLRDRFIVGAGNKTPGSKNSGANLVTDLQGAHTPVIQAVALTVAQMPSHAHNVSVSGSGSFNTGNESQSHTHAGVLNGQNFVSYTGGAGGQGTSGGGFGQSLNTNWADRSHYHAVTVSLSSSGGTDAQGGGAAHTHTANSVAGHQHNMAPATVREAIPYYALAFIMKL